MTWQGWAAAAMALLALILATLAYLRTRTLAHRLVATQASPPAPDAQTPAPRAIAVVYNPLNVGDLDELKSIVEQAAIDAGYAVPVWFPTTAQDPGPKQTRAALALNPAVVIAAGGDGTVRLVGGELAGTGVSLGILPMGTGNLLARNLGLPLNSTARDLASIAITGRRRRIDVGRIHVDPPGPEEAEAIARIDGARAFTGQTPFLVIAGMGFDADVMHNAGRGLKRTMGWGAYIISGLRYLGRGRVKAHILVGEGPNEFDVEARAVLFANCARLPGGFVLAPDARLDDGWLDLVIVDTRGGIIGWGDLVRRVGLQSMGMRKKVLPEAGSIELRRMRSVTVQTSAPELVEADGDTLGYAWNVTASIDRGALLVRVL